MLVQVKVSLGELVDKMSILKIKKKNIEDREKQGHIQKELEELQKTLNELKLEGMEEFEQKPFKINSELWRIEDDIREKEQKQEFDAQFIELARSVYITNDQRFEVKNLINEKFGSDLKEVKSYQKYN